MEKKFKLYYIVTVIVAACSILYELLMAQSLSIITGNAVARYSVTIGLYLAAMGFGAFLCRKKVVQFYLRSLIIVELFFSVFGAMTVAVMHFSHMITNYMYLGGSFYGSAIVFFLITHLFIILIGLLSGLELPLLINLQKKEEPDSNAFAKILGLDYFGSLIGALLFPLLLLPLLGVYKVAFIIAAINGLVALFLIFLYFSKRKNFTITPYAIIGLVILLGIAFSYAKVGSIEQYFLKKYYYYYETAGSASNLFGSTEHLPEVERVRSPYQNIDLVYFPSGEDLDSILAPAYSKKFEQESDFPRDYFLFLNGDYQFYSNVEELYHEWFVHVPIISNKIPKKVLVLGGGDGMVDRELLKYDEIESITHVDLDEKMIEMAKTHPVLKEFNKGSLEDPRVNIIIGDGYQYVRNTDEKYDAVFVDFPTAVDYNLAKLYSSEFYFFVKGVLKEDGFMALDSPGSLILDEPNDWELYYNTFKEAGFNNIVPYVSVLESDNKKAIDTLKDLDIVTTEDTNYPGVDAEEVIISDEEKELAIQQLIDEYVYYSMQGFVFMNDNEDLVDIKWKNYDTDLYMLNKKRYELAFSVPYDTTKYIEKSKVNSILRPTFPSLPFWYTRLPY